MPAIRTDDDTVHPTEALLGEIADLISAELSASGIPGAAVMGNRCARRIATSLGGQSCYFPKAQGGERLLRNIEIRRLFDGTRNGPNGVSALAMRYDMTEVHVYRVLNAARHCQTARRPA
jgi:Mor family transcriptional regulator